MKEASLKSRFFSLCYSVSLNLGEEKPSAASGSSFGNTIRQSRQADAAGWAGWSWGGGASEGNMTERRMSSWQHALLM